MPSTPEIDACVDRMTDLATEADATSWWRSPLKKYRVVRELKTCIEEHRRLIDEMPR